MATVCILGLCPLALRGPRGEEAHTPMQTWSSILLGEHCGGGPHPEHY